MTHHSYSYLDQKISDLQKVATFLDELRYESVPAREEQRIGIAHAVIVEKIRFFNRQKNLITEEECKLKFQNERISQFILENPKRIY